MSSASPSVLAVVNQFPAPSETFILRKLTALHEAGLPVTVAAARFNSGSRETGLDLLPLVSSTNAGVVARQALTSAGRRHLAGAAAAMSGSRSAPQSWRRRLLIAPLAGARADIVHFEFSGIAVAYRDVLDHLRPSKLVVSCRGAAEQIRPLSDPERKSGLADVFSRVDRIHCVSDDIRRTVEGLGAPNDKTFVNRPAVTVGDFRPLRDRRADHDGPLRVLSIGRLHWKKGFDDALRVMAQLRRGGQSVAYRIAGGGPELEKLTFLRDQLGLNEEVELLGVQNQPQIREQLLWADVLALPSLSEGISNAVLEAMASGLPVVSTNCGGMAEVIDHGIDGLLVDVGDIDAMASALSSLGQDAAIRTTMGAAAAVRADRHFDLQRQVDVFLAEYRTLMSTP